MEEASGSAVNIDATRKSFFDPPWYRRHIVAWNSLSQEDVRQQEEKDNMRKLYAERNIKALSAETELGENPDFVDMSLLEKLRALKETIYIDKFTKTIEPNKSGINHLVTHDYSGATWDEISGVYLRPSSLRRHTKFTYQNNDRAAVKGA